MRLEAFKLNKYFTHLHYRPLCHLPGVILYISCNSFSSHAYNTGIGVLIT